MARLFDDAQNEFFHVESAVISAAPFSWACWFRSDDTASTQQLMSIQDKSAHDSNWRLLLRGDIGGDPLQHVAQRLTFSAAQTSAGYSANTWHHAAGVEIASNNRKVLLDGGSKGTNAINESPANIDRTTIGRAGDDSPDGYMSGRIVWPAIWDVVLADEEIESLAAGAYPPTIRPTALVAFWPLGGFDTEETDGGPTRDIWGGFDMAAFSDATGPGIADHPGGLIYPSTGLVFPAAVAPAGAVGSPLQLKSPLIGSVA